MGNNNNQYNEEISINWSYYLLLRIDKGFFMFAVSETCFKIVFDSLLCVLCDEHWSAFYVTYIECFYALLIKESVKYWFNTDI